MKYFERQDIILVVIQLIVWISILLVPCLIIFLISPAGLVHYYYTSSAVMILPLALLYFLCFYLFIPRFLEKGKKVSFILLSIFTIILLNSPYIWLEICAVSGIGEPQTVENLEIARIGLHIFLSVTVSLDAIVVFAAIMHRSYIRTRKRELALQEEKQKTIEAELQWLKNQLNPHFLFNSLNNISSLVQIDPERAQDSIAQLSDLLRYALYESQKPIVPLAGEVEFMQNYIAMMKLRCSDKTEVNEDFQVGTGHEQIAPLLFVSFIENAFKHGTSSNQPSRISVRLHASDGKIVFDCRNTNFPKGKSDHSGSGIGLENTRRRLDLCYPGKYVWEQKIENEEYCIKIEITV